MIMVIMNEVLRHNKVICIAIFTLTMAFATVLSGHILNYFVWVASLFVFPLDFNGHVFNIDAMCEINDSRLLSNKNNAHSSPVKF